MGRVFVDHKVCEAAGAEIKRQPPCLGSGPTPRRLPLKFQRAAWRRRWGHRAALRGGPGTSPTW